MNAIAEVGVSHGPLHPYPPGLRQRALELVAGGASWAQAAREVGVSKGAVGDWIRAQRRVAA